ncbi:MAG: hypothetical protein WA030_01440 [Candidatus Microsaccharimonas sp.]
MAMAKRTKGALWLLIAPTALIVLTFIVFAIANWIFSAVAPSPAEGELFAEPSIGTAIINIILFIVGALASAAWLPGLIVGIVLLASPKK